MCGRYVILSSISEIEERFNVQASESFAANFNLGPGSFGPVITDDAPKKLQYMQFGMTPFWAKKKMYFFNARAEGDHNKANDPAYKGAMGIISKPAFRKSIRDKRCLVIADGFIEGTTTEKLDKPFLVHLGKGERPFAFAGIWDEWIDTETGEILRSFAIITTVPNVLLQKLPHHRSPVILPQGLEGKWLRKEMPLADITAMLRPYEGDDMNAYPISKDIKNPRNNGKELLKPIGPAVGRTKKLVLNQEVMLRGIGWTRAKNRGEGL